MISALAFTLLQASVSALGAVLLGAVWAYVFARMKNDVFARISFLPFFLPPLVVVLAVLNVFGAKGVGLDLFGLLGIVLCHLVLNIPLAAKLFYEGYQDVPEPQVRLAVQFGQVFKLVDLEVFRTRLRRIFAIIFLYALLSFTIVLTLGGGPSTSTLEVAIYQAIRYDYDLALAFQLAMVQALIGVAVYLLAKTSLRENFIATRLHNPLPLQKGKWVVLIIWALVTLFVISPMAFFAFKAIPNMLSLLLSENFRGVLIAIKNSFILAFITVCTAHGLSFLMLKLRIESLAWMLGAVSPLVIAVAMILFMREFLNPFDYGVISVAILQALTYLPFILTYWRLKFDEVSKEEQKLCALYFPNQRTRITRYWLPSFGRPLVDVSAIIFALSIGDLGLIPLFSPPDFTTLPAMVFQLIGSYQIDAANGVSMMMLIMIGVILFMPRAFGGKYA